MALDNQTSENRTSENQPPVTRRSLLRGAAGAGVAGVVIAAGAGAAVAITSDPADDAAKPVGKPVTMAPIAPSAMEGPLVVFISDTKDGKVDVFAGDGQMRMRNPGLVRAVLNSMK